MSAAAKSALLQVIDAAYRQVARPLIFRRSAQQSHDDLIRLLRLLDRLPLTAALASVLHRLTIDPKPIEVGGVVLSQRLILAAGLMKGDGFADEAAAMRAVTQTRRNIIPGWRIVPALAGPVEFGSFTRHPRLGNRGTVLWRHEDTQSTQNRVGLRNSGARAAAYFLSQGRNHLPKEYGINIAVTPGVADIERQTREIVESLEFFLDAGVLPSWFTLNISCPNTEDDPRGYQVEAETRQLCGAFTDCLQSRSHDIPLWIKASPHLAPEQVHSLLRAASEAGVKAVVATNTLPLPCPDDPSLSAGAGGGALLDEALAAVRHLRAALKRSSCAIDLVGCGGILDGETLAEYQALGVEAGQYWSALVYRGPFAAAIIESEFAEHEPEYQRLQRESLA